MKLPPISEDQLKLLDHLENDNNIVVDCSAGTGKTTTSMHIASRFAGSNVLLLTYSKKLKIDSRTRAINCGIDNIEIHSFHAFGVKYYNPKAYNDIRISIKTAKPRKAFQYDIIILDECQYVTPD